MGSWGATTADESKTKYLTTEDYIERADYLAWEN